MPGAGTSAPRERCGCERRCPRRLGVLDMGSTSFHLLVADVCASGRVQEVARRRAHLELGRWIAGKRKIPNRVWDEVLESAVELRELAQQHQVERLLPVGTAAFRELASGAELSAQLERALGVPVRVLSGVEEACTLFAALRQRHGRLSEPCLGIDLGGGSLELARGCAQDVEAALSLPLGVVHLHSAFSVPDPIPSAVEADLRAHVRAALEEAGAPSIARDASDVLASGGALRALARIAAEREGGRAPGGLGARRLESLCAELVRAPRAVREQMPGMSARRVNTLPTAAVIVSEFMRVLDLSSLTVSDWGLREGVLLEAARGHR